MIRPPRPSPCSALLATGLVCLLGAASCTLDPGTSPAPARDAGGAAGKGGAAGATAGQGGGGAGGAGGAGSGGAPDETGGGGGAAGGSDAGAAAGRDGGAGAGGGGGGAGGYMAATGPNKVFGTCRFHFGTLDSVAKSNPSIIPQIDFFTPGWMGSTDTFSQTGVCTEANPGGALAGKVPVIVSYVAAFYVKRHFQLADCNATSGTQSLCTYGAQRIQENLNAIINVYRSFAQGFAGCYGTSKPIVFEMEPDWYQYIASTQTQPMTEDQAGMIMGQFVSTIKQALPNAFFSMDVSPWVGSNGTDNGKEWFSHFDMSQFTFISTSGGGTDATAAKIRSANQMTWAGVSAVTGKPILADTGYSVNGRSAGPDAAWDMAANINARIMDGALSISQYNPNGGTWGATISGVRSQLIGPRFCP